MLLVCFYILQSSTSLHLFRPFPSLTPVSPEEIPGLSSTFLCSLTLYTRSVSFVVYVSRTPGPHKPTTSSFSSLCSRDLPATLGLTPPRDRRTGSWTTESTRVDSYAHRGHRGTSREVTGIPRERTHLVGGVSGFRLLSVQTHRTGVLISGGGGRVTSSSPFSPRRVGVSGDVGVAVDRVFLQFLPFLEGNFLR